MATIGGRGCGATDHGDAQGDGFVVISFFLISRCSMIVACLWHAALLVSAISSPNSDESRPDASAPTSRDGGS